MIGLVPLRDARQHDIYGSKAVGLGDAARAGLPLPPGFALSGELVEAVASGEEPAIDQLLATVDELPRPLAVRSSAVDEDSADASFAGQHLTLLGVPSTEGVSAAVKEIWWSANSDSAITYRQRVGLFARPSVGVVVQSLVNADVAGVMFTRNPVNGADERVIEASWGLGEVVVNGSVIPDLFRVSSEGVVFERTPGLKKVAVRLRLDGGTVEEQIPPEEAEQLCLDDTQLAELNRLAASCEQVYGPARDIEWAIADGRLYLLQCRAVTRTGADAPAPRQLQPSLDELERVPVFAQLTGDELAEVSSLFKERRFGAGETVTKEGSGGAAFYLIQSGNATVSVRGKVRGQLTAGDFFGEIALIDGGERAATVIADTELVCHGLTYWDFRPLVQRNGAIAWGLLQSLAKMLRDEQKRID
jgi:pyruvate,water dikinase